MSIAKVIKKNNGEMPCKITTEKNILVIPTYPLSLGTLFHNFSCEKTNQICIYHKQINSLTSMYKISDLKIDH